MAENRSNVNREEKLAKPEVRSADQVELSVEWDAEDRPPVLTANQFAVQFDGEQFYLTVGQVMPPLASGTPEEIREKIQNREVLISRLASFSLTPGQMRVLDALLSQSIQQVDTALANRGAGGRK